MKGRYASMIA